MKKISNKTKTSAVALVLLMASVMLMAMPVKAQELEPQPSGSQPLPPGVTPDVVQDTTAYLSFRPNPVGVDQTILVNIWISPGLSSSLYLSDYKVTITDPDGNEDVITMDSYQADATAWFEYVVDQVGTWKLKFEFPGGYFPAGIYAHPRAGMPDRIYPHSMYFEPASTAEQTLVVQQEPVLSWPESPLPTDYWTRPVPFEHREWASILGDYPWHGPGGGPDWPADTSPYSSPQYSFTPYVQAPNTAHIVWKRQGAISGLAGAGQGYAAITTGGGNPSIIYQGRAYQSVTKPFNGETQSVWQCYDIRTGEVYWERTGVTAPTAIEYAYGTIAVPGEEPKLGMPNLVYIGGGRLIKYNPYTGAVTRDESIAPLTTGLYYRNGYALSVQNLGGGQYRLINWTTLGSAGNFASRVVNNITWPWMHPFEFGGLGNVLDFDRGIVAWVEWLDPDNYGYVNAMAFTGTWIRAASLTTGEMLWNITVDDTCYSPITSVADHGKIAVLMQEGYYLAYDVYSGDLAWKSEGMDYPWSQPGFGAYDATSAYGMFYRQAYDGVYAFNWTNGKIVWKYKAPAPYAYETPYIDENGQTVYSFNGASMVADGKLYTYNTEHTPTAPITRGWNLHCINATTGEGIWKIMMPGDVGPVADGYLSVSSMDGYQYVFGKGKSATTVSAPQTSVPKGTTVLIQGTVLDQSPAQPGTPCVSKESMATYMEYLHKQMPIPDGYVVTGVPVTLLAISSDGDVIEIDTVTSDVSGSFQCVWTPPDEGLYKITASFLGDDSYGSSWAETGLSVGPAPELAPEYGSPEWPSYPEAPAYTAIDLAIIAAVVVAIIIGIVSILDHRRMRK